MSYKDLKLNLPTSLLPSKLDFNEIDRHYTCLSENQQDNQNLIGIEYIILDGPPYANGSLHIGHVINRTIKDLIARNALVFLNKKVKYMMGWDCHGLPIEAKAMQNLGGGVRHSTLHGRDTINHESKQIMQFYLEKQRSQLKSYHMLTYDDCYKTHSTQYIKNTLRTLWHLVKTNYISYIKKTNFYSIEEQTNLAFAEIEYKDKTSISLFFKARITNEDLYLVIWTTQPWTILGNKFIAINPNIQYVIVQLEDHRCVVSQTYAKEHKINIIKSVSCQWLLERTYIMIHATEERKIIQDTNIVKDNGTGILHIAPAHGFEDFEIGVKHHLNPKTITNCINSNGYALHKQFASYNVTNNQLNKAVLQTLYDQCLVVHEGEIVHSYPHSCRSKKPVFILADKQVIINIDEIDKQEVLANFSRSVWSAKEGFHTYSTLINQRPSLWCITRQRHWGTPCMLFIDKDDNIIYDEALNHYLIELVEKHGLDFWYNDEFVYGILADYELESVYQHRITCILDVWFESGVAALNLFDVIQDYRHIDAIVEGKDQHRGWFSSIGIINAISKKSVKINNICVHGFACYMKNKKISKSNEDSLKQANDIMENTYSEILRLYIAFSDFYQDIIVNEDNINNAKKLYLTLYGIMRFFVNILSHKPQQDHEDITISTLNTYLYRQYSAKYHEIHNNILSGNINTLSHSINAIIKTCKEIIRINKDDIYCGEINSAQSIGILNLFQYLLFTISKTTYLICPGLAMFCMSKHIKINSEYEYVTQVRNYKSKFDDSVATQDVEFWDTVYEIYTLINIKIDLHKKNKVVTSNYCMDVVFVDIEGNFEKIKLYRESMIKLLDVSNVVYSGKANMQEQKSIILDQIEFQCMKVYIRNISGIYYKCYRCWKYLNNAPDQLCTRCYSILNK